MNERDIASKFWSRVRKTENDNECWIWLTWRFPDGYGGIKIDGKGKRAHRVAYELMIGPIPPDREVHHICENRLCVNPRHLQLVDDRGHMLVSPRWRAYQERLQTHCIRGHEFTPENTRFCKGHRSCITCHNTYMIEWRQHRRQETIIR